MNLELIHKQWKIIASQGRLTARHYFQRAILIALAAKNTKNVPREDIALALLQKYFTPVTNANELANGRESYDTIKNIQRALKWSAKNMDLIGASWSDLLTDEEWSIYFDMVKNIKFDRLGRKYLYYFTVQDISPEQQGVQAGHVLFKLGMILGNNKTIDPDHTYFQWIGVKDDSELVEVISNHQNLDYAIFQESDLGNRITSVAFVPVLWNERDEFVEYELLTHYAKE